MVKLKNRTLASSAVLFGTVAGIIALFIPIVFVAYKEIKTFLITCYTVLKNRTYVVYGDCNKVVATFSVARRDDALYFSKLAVFPAFAGTGIGSFCLLQIKNIAKSQNFEKLRCDVYEKSEHAVSFYFKHGFYLVGRKHTRKYDEMILEKQI